jgi:hypothetical protein
MSYVVPWAKVVERHRQLDRSLERGAASAAKANLTGPASWLRLALMTPISAGVGCDGGDAPGATYRNRGVYGDEAVFFDPGRVAAGTCRRSSSKARRLNERRAHPSTP